MLYDKPNKQILEELDKVVYGHTSAKKTLINLVNRSKMRYSQKYLSKRAPIADNSGSTREKRVPLSRQNSYHIQESHPDFDDLIETRNCLLIGSSGTGKTHLVHSLSKICHFPLLEVDANELAPTSNNDGLNVARLQKALYKTIDKAMQNDPSRYHSLEGTKDQTIIYVDEIDKLATAFDSSGNWNKHVQANFLKVFEGHKEFEGVSFIFSGAFATMDIYDINKPKNLGFTHNNKVLEHEHDLEQKVIKYGLVPELLGRIHNIVLLDKLEKEDFKKILNTLVLPKAKKELSWFNIDKFELTEEQEEFIIDKAMNSQLGVRSLIKEVSKLCQELEFDYESNKKQITKKDTI